MELITIQNINSVFNSWDGSAYSNSIFRSAVDSIARNIGKLKGSHYITDSNNNKFEKDKRLNRILQIQPNKAMTAYDLLYKIATHYFLYNNAFILIDFDENRTVRGLYPVDAVQTQILESPQHELYIAFRLRNGKEYTFRYCDVIHLKRHFNRNAIFGDDNSPIGLTLELSQTQNEGMINSIQNSATIRGVLNVKEITTDKALEKIKDDLEYQELKYAIEALGGEYTRPRDFSNDPYFKEIAEQSQLPADFDLMKKQSN